MSRADLLRRAGAALGILPARERATILLVDVIGRSLSTAAGELGIPIGTLKTHLFCGRRHLRRLVERDGEQ